MPHESTPATSHCPWCSTSVPAGTEVCPSCGAALVTSADGGVPGLTAIDAEAVLRNRAQPKSRGGLLGFLSGETGDTVDAPTESELASLAPPDAKVRMEMLRLEIEAERQRLDDEGASLAADVAEQTGTAIPAGLFGDASDVPDPGVSATAAATPPGPEAKSPTPPPPGPEPTPGA
jgi:hypothetical protein